MLKDEHNWEIHEKYQKRNQNSKKQMKILKIKQLNMWEKTFILQTYRIGLEE